MWAQLSSTRVKEGQAGAVVEAMHGLREFEQPGSGLIRTIVLQDQRDPQRVHVLVVFESEEKARAREADPRREAGVQALRAALAEVLEAPPEFTDLDVLAKLVP